MITIPKLTKEDEHYIRELAKQVGVRISYIDRKSLVIKVEGAPDKVEEFYELWFQDKTDM